jgi:hypothetical protein
MGTCPCPRCLIPKTRVCNLGMPRDRQQRETLARISDARHLSLVESARKIIYVNNRTVNSTFVENLLKEESLVPTTVGNIRSIAFVLSDPSQNAFSERLGDFGFDMFKTLVVDLMHEIELGIWRALLIHLLRILQAVNPGLIHELDRR